MPKVVRIVLSAVGAALFLGVAWFVVMVLLLLLSPWPCDERNCGSGPSPPNWLVGALVLPALMMFVAYIIGCVRWIARR